MTNEEIKAQVKEAVMAALKAGNTGDVDAWLDSFHPEFAGFIQDNGLLLDGPLSKDLAKAAFSAGLKFENDIRHLDIRPCGDVAIVLCYLVGTITSPDGGITEGTYRTTWVYAKHEGKWKCVHSHHSPLTPVNETRHA